VAARPKGAPLAEEPSSSEGRAFRLPSFLPQSSTAEPSSDESAAEVVPIPSADRPGSGRSTMRVRTVGRAVELLVVLLVASSASFRSAAARRVRAGEAAAVLAGGRSASPASMSGSVHCS
jgi:hypothetical protein